MAELQWVYVDGARLTPYMAYQINRLKKDFRARWGLDILVSSGVRTEQEQTAIFLARYVLANNVRGRKVYDTRWWNGRLWYRVSSAGTVAAPNSPQANHQIRGTKGAVDLRDSGRDAGVMTKTSPRGRWLRENAKKYDLVPEGDGFGEGWHFAVLNVLNAVPGSGASTGSKPLPTTKEIKTVTKQYVHQDVDARAKGRVLKPGEHFYLNIKAGQPRSQATNIALGAGKYDFIAHLYAEGKVGDSIEFYLVYQQTTVKPPKNSNHYKELVAITNRAGLVRRSVSFSRPVGTGQAVYLLCRAASDNVEPVTVTTLDVDVQLFT